MSTEAEKYLKENPLTKPGSRLNYTDNFLKEVAEKCESYHQHRMKELLSELSDEKIYDLISENAPHFYCDVSPSNHCTMECRKKCTELMGAAKAIREFIKGKQ